MLGYVKGSKTIDIEDFVNVKDVDIVFFDKPYYIVPKKGPEKGYALLQKVLQRSAKAGIAKIGLHRRQHLAALIVRSGYIVLELLRFADQVLQLDAVDDIAPGIKEAKISERELNIAEQLVEGMTSDWDPSKYKDTYKEEMMKVIEKKVRTGKVASVAEGEADDDTHVTVDDNIVDLMALLRKSLVAGESKKRSGSRKNA